MAAAIRLATGSIAHATPPVEIAPAWTFEPNQPNAYLGYTLSAAGDVNGDGFDDALIGSYEWNEGYSNEGRAWLFPGSVGGPSGLPAWTFTGVVRYSHVGWSVAPAGDVNHDGFADVLVGARQVTQTAFYEGVAYLFLGSPTGLAATPAWQVGSGQSFSSFGHAVAAGDVNGDGERDMIVTARLFDAAQPDVGRLFVYLGTPVGPLSTPATVIDGSQTGADFGFSIAVADVNHDGFDDVFVSAPLFDGAAADEGRTWLYLGSAAGLSTQPAWSFSGAQTNEQLGISGAAAGDVNADGFADVAVGAHLFDADFQDEGRVLVFHGGAAGLSETPDWTARGGQLWANLGRSVAGLGDFDGDGFDDLAASAPAYDTHGNNDGRVAIYRGSANGLAVEPAFVAVGSPVPAWFGFAISAAGDLNGDGRKDLLVGAWSYTDGELGEGRALAYLGRSAVCNAGGDLNGDGLIDGADVQQFTQALLASNGGAGACAADIDQDGLITPTDAERLVGSLLGL